MDKAIIKEALLNLYRKAMYEEREGCLITSFNNEHLSSCINQIEGELEKE